MKKNLNLDKLFCYTIYIIILVTVLVLIIMRNVRGWKSDNLLNMQ